MAWTEYPRFLKLEILSPLNLNTCKVAFIRNVLVSLYFYHTGSMFVFYLQVAYWMLPQRQPHFGTDFQKAVSESWHQQCQ